MEGKDSSRMGQVKVN